MTMDTARISPSVLRGALFLLALSPASLLAGSEPGPDCFPLLASGGSRSNASISGVDSSGCVVPESSKLRTVDVAAPSATSVQRADRVPEGVSLVGATSRGIGAFESRAGVVLDAVWCRSSGTKTRLARALASSLQASDFDVMQRREDPPEAHAVRQGERWMYASGAPAFERLEVDALISLDSAGSPELHVVWDVRVAPRESALATGAPPASLDAARIYVESLSEKLVERLEDTLRETCRVTSLNIGQDACDSVVQTPSDRLPDDARQRALQLCGGR